MTKVLGISFAAVCLMLGFAMPAFAVDVYVDNVTLPYSDTVNLSGTIDGLTVNDNGQLAGQIVLTVNDGLSYSSSQYTVPVWCVDIFHDIYLGSSGDRYSEGTLDTDNSTAPTRLTSLQIAKITALVSYGNAQMLTNPTASTSVEVQAAIWTVEYNNSSGNNLVVSSTDNSFTLTDISNLIAEVSGGNGGQLIALDGSQGFAFGKVPEPASLGLLAAGLFGIGFARRRKSCIA